MCARRSSVCSAANCSSASRCASVSSLGTTTCTLTFRSPLPEPLSCGAPLPRMRKTLPSCVPAGILSLTFVAVRRRHSDFGAERRLGDRDRQIEHHVGAVSLVVGVMLDVRDDVQVARRAAVDSRLALALEAQLAAVGRASRHVDRDRLARCAPCPASARGARLLDDLAAPAAARAWPRERRTCPGPRPACRCRRTPGTSSAPCPAWRRSRRRSRTSRRRRPRPASTCRRTPARTSGRDRAARLGRAAAGAAGAPTSAAASEATAEHAAEQIAEVAQVAHVDGLVLRSARTAQPPDPPAP